MTPRSLSRLPSSSDHLGWFAHYAHRWEYRTKQGDTTQARHCEQLAIWYLLIHLEKVTP